MKKFTLTLMGASLALLMACSSESTISGGENGGSDLPSGGENGGASGSADAGSYYASFPTQNATAVQTLYQNWINKFYVEAETEITEPGDLGMLYDKLKGSARIKFDIPSNTVSEGMGYGMLITYFMKDWVKFDKLFKYYQFYPVSANDGLYFMRWKIIGDKFNGGFSAAGTGGSATDADLDAALAMLLAYAETGKAEYLDYGVKVAKSIYATEINPETHLLVPANDGGKLSNGYCYNISYFSLVALRMFAKYDTENSAGWNQVLDATLAYMKKVQDAGNGLWPDWSDANGSPIDPENNSSTGKLNNYYGLEGVRIPWRIAWDYDWFGDDRTKALVTRAAQFAMDKTGGDINQTLNSYIYVGTEDGRGLGGAHYRGAFCALWTVSPDYAANVEACNNVVLNLPFPAGNNYFQPSLQMLYSLYLNGYFTKVWNN